jgi:hypothetical protein
VASTAPPRTATRCAVAVAAGAAFLIALSACNAPFDLGEPSTRSVENGLVDTLTAARSFELSGSYSEATPSCPIPVTSSSRVSCPVSAAQWSIDLQVVRPAFQHVVVSKAGLKLEAIIFLDPTGFSPADAYFRGNEFLSQHMGSDPASRNLVRAAGNAWWRGSAGQVPQLLDFTDGTVFRSTFLGTNLTQRIDHVAVDGLEAVNLSGPRADVFVAANAPHRLLRLHLKKGATIDGISDADFHYSNFDQAFFQIAKPTDVIDFSNLSTLPPIYTVVSVDTSRCGATCVVSALLKNLGGKLGAKAPSTITFAMTDSATRQTVGGCQAQVKPDVSYDELTTVSCTISAVSGKQINAAIVTATPENPGRG